MQKNNKIFKKIPVTVDKSHLITIGEKLYTEKSSFIRELVNNGYDADASEVYVTISPKCVSIKDNGAGMDENGLRHYFTIGASNKKQRNTSPIFKRTRIGEFGIGKFSALSVCDRFEIETQKGNYHARLVFDRERWQQREDWDIEIEELPVDVVLGNGTTITLHNVSIQFAPGKVRRYLSERTPIHAPHFKVFLNNEIVGSEIMTGTRIPINFETEFGLIEGYLLISSNRRQIKQTGVAVTVKGVLVRYEDFGLARSHGWGASRITGRVNADFLPITSNRDDFIRDSREFLFFTEQIKKQVIKALQVLKKEGDRKANRQASRVLKKTMQKIGKAMRRHHELFPQTQVAIGNESVDEQGKTVHSNNDGYKISDAKFVPTGDGLSIDPNFNKIPKQKRKRHNKAILGDKSVIRNLRVANMDIAVRMEHLGDETESVVSGGVIFVNLDHPLYRTFHEDEEALTFHISRILTKELTLRTGINDPQQAFAVQSELLTDAFKKRGT